MSVELATVAELSVPRQGTTSAVLDVTANRGSVSLSVSTEAVDIDVMLLPEGVADLRDQLDAAVEQLDEDAVADRRDWLTAGGEQ